MAAFSSAEGFLKHFTAVTLKAHHFEVADFPAKVKWQRPCARPRYDSPKFLERGFWANQQPDFPVIFGEQTFSLLHPTICLSMIHNGRSIIQEMQQEGNRKGLKTVKVNVRREEGASDSISGGWGGAPQLVTQCTRGVFTLAEAPHAERRGRALGTKAKEDRR